MPKTEPKSPFALALAARKGNIKEEDLPQGAARLLFNDRLLTQEQLKQFADGPDQLFKPKKRKIIRTFKRG